jgi:hypothetical protein
MRKLTGLAVILVLFGISSWAQEVRNEVTVQGSGFFKKQTTVGGLPTRQWTLAAWWPDTGLTSKNGWRSKATMIISGMIRSSRRAAALHPYRRTFTPLQVLLSWSFLLSSCRVPMAKHVAFRAQYRGFVYKIPDFEMTSLKLDKYTHSAVPSASLVVTF